jgi:D-beta-D-heptose 7-phosphate kinase/D-beta-D-heptose 1-phosphate adenosyltransferase
VSATPPKHKILARASLLERFGRPRDQIIVFTNGCFDLIHRGHVAYLDAARRFGDMLVVGVNTDASVRRLHKGPGRPLVAEEDRAYVLAALECVDVVTLFDEDTPRELVSALLPDVLAKGGDYDLAAVVGREEVEAAGGKVVLVPYVEGYSTTELIRRMQRSGR